MLASSAFLPLPLPWPAPLRSPDSSSSSSTVLQEDHDHLHSHTRHPRAHLSSPHGQKHDPLANQPEAVAPDASVGEANLLEPEMIIVANDNGYTVHQLNTIMGAALVLGFLFMMMVEHFGSSHTHHSTSVKTTGVCVCVCL